MKLVPMEHQWGSCSPAGSINLNPALIRAPRHCIDYVLLHEICHLKEHNHSKRFYALLEMHSPQWVDTKAELDQLAELLLAA
jgi:predicted metal-dependent hydrolase